MAQINFQQWNIFKFSNKSFFLNKISNLLIEINADQFDLLKKLRFSDGKVKPDFDITPLFQNIPNPLDTRETYLSSQVYNQISSVRIEITENCNFRCVYCFGNFGRKDKTTSISKEALSSFLNDFFQYPDLPPKITFSFFGGEPLLGFDKIVLFVEKVESLKANKKVNYSVSTNGSIINQEIISFFQKYNFSVLVSIDGIEEANIYRVNNQNENTFKTIDKTLSLLMANKVVSNATLVLTPFSTPFLPQSLEYLIKKGVTYINLAIVDSNSSPTAIGSFVHDEDFEKLEYYLTESADLFIRLLNQGFKFSISPLDKFVSALLIRKNTNFYCSAIRGSSLFLSAKNQLYPCSKFKEVLGNSDTDIFKNLSLKAVTDKLQSFAKLPNNYSDCQNCLITNFCSGPCIMRNFSLYQTFEIDKAFDNDNCRFHILTFKMAAYLISNLSQEQLFLITGNSKGV